MQHFTRLAELRVAHEEQHFYNFEFELSDCTCSVLSIKNTFSVRVPVETTKHIVGIQTVEELLI